MCCSFVALAVFPPVGLRFCDGFDHGDVRVEPIYNTAPSGANDERSSEVRLHNYFSVERQEEQVPHGDRCTCCVAAGLSTGSTGSRETDSGGNPKRNWNRRQRGCRGNQDGATACQTGETPSRFSFLAVDFCRSHGSTQSTRAVRCGRLAGFPYVFRRLLLQIVQVV